MKKEIDKQYENRINKKIQFLRVFRDSRRKSKVVSSETKTKKMQNIVDNVDSFLIAGKTIYIVSNNSQVRRIKKYLSNLDREGIVKKECKC